jgi:hypothetical protein
MSPGARLVARPPGSFSFTLPTSRPPGVAVWAWFKLSQIDPRFDIGVKAPVIERARNTWSQAEGLALFLLIDSMVSDWRERVLGPSLASPFALLEEALGTRAR